jgi:LacI family transcriptional regulator
LKPTIKDVAREAGVSLATVSRVINGSGYYDAETDRRVRAAVTSLGYRKNIHWSRLASKSSHTVCYLLGNRDVMNTTQMRLLVSSQETLREHGYDLIFAGFRYSEATRGAQLELPPVLAQHGIVDGVVLAGRHYGNLLEAFERLRMPYVLMGSNFVGSEKQLALNAVTFNDEDACYEATGHLLRLGHRRIAFVGNAAVPWFRRRQAGYERALRASKAPAMSANEDWQVSGVEYGRMAAAELLRRPEPPTAIMAANDELAAGIWKELAHRGIRIPRRISLIGFGDREEFQILEPSLTSVSVFPDKLGAALAEMLVRRIAEPEARMESRVFPCQLMERASCGPPPARSAKAGR